jgi:hypothetical protein
VTEEIDIGIMKGDSFMHNGRPTFYIYTSQAVFPFGTSTYKKAGCLQHFCFTSSVSGLKRLFALTALDQTPVIGRVVLVEKFFIA